MGTLDVAPGAVGVIDVPAEQRRAPLRWRPEDGNLAMIGSVGSGTTTALLSVLAAVCSERSSDELHVYVIDAKGDPRWSTIAEAAHCGAVVGPHERERLGRLLHTLALELDGRRAGARPRRRAVILAIDGLPALRAALDGPLGMTDDDLLLRVIAEGRATDIVTVLTAERPGAVSPSLLAGCAERWVFHLDDALEASACGVPPSFVPPAIAGRLIIGSTGLEAQIVPVAMPSDAVADGLGGAPPIGTLSELVDAATLPPGWAVDGDTTLVVGTEFHGLGPATLDVPDGEHVLVAGPPRSGRSSALVRLAESWRQAHPDGVVVVSCPIRRSPLLAWADGVPAASIVVAADVPVALADAPSSGPCLVAVDDAERVVDPDGALAALVAERRTGLLFVAGGRPDALRGLYGHWSALVRRSRLGLLMSMCADTDGDVLGELLPRASPLRPRPGLGWLVGGRQRSLVQVGHDDIDRVVRGAPLT